MTKCAPGVVAMFLTCTLSAQEARPGVGRAELFGPRREASEAFVALTLSDRRHFALANSLGWMPAADYLPVFVAEEPRRVVASPACRQEAEGKSVMMESDPVYAHGEVGFLYGKSAGKRGGEEKAGYIIGEVGNDKVQITAGASYEESTQRFPRSRR